MLCFREHPEFTDMNYSCRLLSELLKGLISGLVLIIWIGLTNTWINNTNTITKHTRHTGPTSRREDDTQACLQPK